MKNLVDYQSEEAFVAMKWNNPAGKVTGKKLQGQQTIKSGA